MPPAGTTSYIVRIGDLPALRAQVAEIARNDHLTVERLLGQLAHIESITDGRDPADRVDFVPVHGCAEIAQRAIEKLHSLPFGRRSSGRFSRRAS
jgi:hypothetical protein